MVDSQKRERRAVQRSNVAGRPGLRAGGGERRGEDSSEELVPDVKADEPGSSGGEGGGGVTKYGLARRIATAWSAHTSRDTLDVLLTR